MKLYRSIRYLALASALTVATPTIAEPWREASSDHFVIYAQYSAEALRAYAAGLERFDKALRVLQHLPDRPVGKANRVTVYVVDKSDTVARLAGAPGSDIAGFYRARAGGSIAVTSQEKPEHWADITPQILLLHEYAHHFMLRNFPAAYPAWYREGFAEFYSTSQSDPDGGVTIGVPANHRAYEFSMLKHPDIPLMLADPANANGVGDMTLYAFGWALTHYLTFEPSRKGQLAAYLDAVNKGRPAREAAVSAFGDLRQLEREVMVYRVRGHMKVMHIAAAELGTSPVAVRELSPGEAAMVPIALRVALADPDRTDHDIASDAQRIADRGAADGPTLLTLAEADLAGHRLDAADAVAARVLATDPQAIRGYMVRADVALRRSAASTATTDKQRYAHDARGFAVKANRLDPDNPRPLVLFYRSFAAADDVPSANASTGLLTAHLLAPEDTALTLMLARQMIAEAKPDQATLLLKPVAYDPHGGTQRADAIALLATLAPTPPATSAAIPAASPAARP